MGLRPGGAAGPTRDTLSNTGQVSKTECPKVKMKSLGSFYVEYMRNHIFDLGVKLDTLLKLISPVSFYFLKCGCQENLGDMWAGTVFPRGSAGLEHGKAGEGPGG